MNTIKNNMQKGIFFLFLFVLCTYSCSSDDPLPVIPESEIAVDGENQETNAETGDDDSSQDDNTTTDDNSTTNDDDTSGNDDTTDDDTQDEGDDTVDVICDNPSGFIFNETEGLVMVEFENGLFSGSWNLKNSGESHTGDGYMVWEGPQYFNTPGNGIGTFKIKINNPGTYRFIWYNAIKTGNNGTEHNDTWLRFNDANDFFAQKGNSIIYPNDTGKSPNPKGASKDGWFKIFRSGNDLDFKWQSRTSDNDAHEVYVKFNTAGIYTMEVSARSSGHAIDKFVLFKSNWSEAEATAGIEQSTISCD